MADVVQKCVSAEDVNNGGVIVAVGSHKFDEDHQRVKAETATESLTVVEARLQDRFDDNSYYTS